MDASRASSRHGCRVDAESLSTTDKAKGPRMINARRGLGARFLWPLSLPCSKESGPPLRAERFTSRVRVLADGKAASCSPVTTLRIFRTAMGESQYPVAVISCHRGYLDAGFRRHDDATNLWDAILARC